MLKLLSLALGLSSFFTNEKPLVLNVQKSCETIEVNGFQIQESFQIDNDLVFAYAIPKTHHNNHEGLRILLLAKGQIKYQSKNNKAAGAIDPSFYKLNDGSIAVEFQNNIDQASVVDNSKKLTGSLMYFYASGEIKQTEKYIENLLVSCSDFYLQNGKRLSKGSFHDGHGLRYFYNDNGIKVKSISYEHGQLHGTCYNYFENGSVKEKFHYKKGALNEDFVTFFNNGRVSNVQHFKNGQLHGAYLEYDQNDQIKTRGYYINNEKNGLWLTYYTNSNIIASKFFYQEGKKIGDGYEYFPDGHINKSWIVQNANLVYYSEFNEVGHKLHEAYYDATGNKQGLYREFYANGWIKTQAHYLNNKMEGEFHEYYDNGFLKEHGFMINDKHSGFWSFYHHNGHLLSEGYYLAGVKNGTWLAYSAHGKKAHEENWEYGNLINITDQELEIQTRR